MSNLNEQALAICRDVIQQWNPYGLSHGESDRNDELEREVISIVKQIDRIDSARSAAHAISRTFTSSFNDPNRFSVEACMDAGTELFVRLTNAGIITT